MFGLNRPRPTVGVSPAHAALLAANARVAEIDAQVEELQQSVAAENALLLERSNLEVELRHLGKDDASSRAARTRIETHLAATRAQAVVAEQKVAEVGERMNALQAERAVKSSARLTVDAVAESIEEGNAEAAPHIAALKRILAGCSESMSRLSGMRPDSTQTAIRLRRLDIFNLKSLFD